MARLTRLGNYLSFITGCIGAVVIVTLAVAVIAVHPVPEGVVYVTV